MPKELTRAEIIPYEPDAVNTDEGIVLKKDIRHKIFSQTVNTDEGIVLKKDIRHKIFSQTVFQYSLCVCFAKHYNTYHL